MEENTGQPALRRGYFPLRICVTDRKGERAGELAERFVGLAAERHDLQVLQAPGPGGEALIAVPFPDKELVRVEFNVFACEAEDECGEPLRYRFFMESAF